MGARQSFPQQALSRIDQKINEALVTHGLIEDRATLDIAKIYWDADGNLRYGVSERNRDVEVLEILSRDTNEDEEVARVWMIIPSRWVRNWLLFAHLKIVDEPPGPIDMASLMQRDDSVEGGWRPRKTLRPPGKGTQGKEVAANTNVPSAPKKKKEKSDKGAKKQQQQQQRQQSSSFFSCCCGGGGGKGDVANQSGAAQPASASCCAPNPSWSGQGGKTKAAPRPSLGPKAQAASAAAKAQGEAARENYTPTPEDADDFPGHYRRISVEAWTQLVEMYGVTEPRCAMAVRGTPYNDVNRWRVFFKDPTAIDPSVLPEGDGKHFFKDEAVDDEKYAPGKYVKKAAGAVLGFFGLGAKK